MITLPQRIKILILFLAILLALAFIFRIFSKQVYMTDEVDTGNYLDRNNVIEPVLQVGRYYLNGNNEECFFEVIPDNIIKLIGSNEQVDELHKFKYPYYDTEVGEKKIQLEELLKKDISFWSIPRQYIVYTEFFPNRKITYVAVKWTIDSNGNYSSLSGLGYIDSKTLNYCGHNFILLENDDT